MKEVWGLANESLYSSKEPQPLPLKHVVLCMLKSLWFAFSMMNTTSHLGVPTTAHRIVHCIIIQMYCGLYGLFYGFLIRHVISATNMLMICHSIESVTESDNIIKHEYV